MTCHNCGDYINSNNCDYCDKNNYLRSDCNSMNKIISTFDKIIDYKKIQFESVISLKDIVSNISSLIQNSLCSDSDCFKQEVLSAANQYISISNRSCDCKKISLIGNYKMYGTVENISGYPISYANGFGGIRPSNNINGELIVDLKGSNKTSFPMVTGEDVNSLANKIRKKMCSKICVVDGIEIGIKFDNLNLFTLTVDSLNLGSTTSQFNINNNFDESDYINLIEEIKSSFQLYIDRIWHIEDTIRIIFNAGYNITLLNDNNSLGSITLSSFVNDKPTSSINILPANSYTAYGYLEFYNSSQSFVIRYPNGSLSEIPINVTMNQISPNNEGYCNNATFNLTNVWSCNFENLVKMCIRYDRCSKNIIEIKIFNSRALLLKNLLKCLNFDCNAYDSWRRNNVIMSLKSLSDQLYNIGLIIENQKNLMKIMKCDYIEFKQKCCTKKNGRKKC